MKILTYNCCAIPFFSGDIVARLRRIAKRVSTLDPDIFLLQELFLPRHVKELRPRLARWPHFFTAVKAWRTFGGGLAVFSKFPLDKTHFVRFRSQGPLLRYSLLARVSRKGYISTVVRPPGGKDFRLICTHLIADYRIWRSGPAGSDGHGAKTWAEYLWKRGALARGDPYPNLQGKQLDQLKAHIKRKPRDLPLILGGDLNMPPHSKLLRGFIRETGLSDTMERAVEPTVIGRKYYRLPFHDAPKKRLDYVLCREGKRGSYRARRHRYVLTQPAKISELRHVTLSDHFGVLVDLERRD